MKIDPYEAAVRLDVAARPPRAFADGRGRRPTEHRGKRRLDAVRGRAAIALRHCARRMTQVLATQAQRPLVPSPAVFNHRAPGPLA